MTDPSNVNQPACPDETAPPGEECAACQPKTVMTEEEKSILDRLREIKEEVRPVTDRLKELKTAQSSDQSNGEYDRLVTRLEDLRSQWADWQEKLDRAIEEKLIRLGHREPK